MNLASWYLYLCVVIPHSEQDKLVYQLGTEEVLVCDF